jgi:endonuclease III related protein
MDDRKLKAALADIYKRLLKAYGSQYWWPAEEPFEVIVGAILTQSAAWTNVEKAISNLKKANALSPASLREIQETELARLIYPSGYYNAKARKLKAFAIWLGTEYTDSLEKLFKTSTGSLREQLLAVYGIEEETADSIILYAGNKPVFVIDAYTRRIIDRLGLTPTPNKYQDYQNLFTSALPHDVQLFNEYHALLVKLGKEACRKKPLCKQCCLVKAKIETAISPSDTYPCADLLQ